MLPAPAECFKATRSPLKGASSDTALLRVQLCAGAKDAAPLVNCVTAAPYRLTPEAKVQLCSGAAAGHGDDKSDSHHHHHHHHNNNNAKRDRTKKVAVGEGPAECMKSLTSLHFERDAEDLSLALQLCSGAGIAPTVCGTFPWPPGSPPRLPVAPSRIWRFATMEAALRPASRRVRRTWTKPTASSSAREP